MSGYCKQPHAKAKALIIEDDGKADDQDEANPFSFKEFVKSKTVSGLSCNNLDGAFSQDANQSTTLFRGPSEAIGMSLGYQETFFNDPTVNDDSLDDEDDDWSGSYHPSVIERTHFNKADSSPGSTEDESYVYNTSDLAADGIFTGWQQASVTSLSPSVHIKPELYSDNASRSAENLQFQKLQINCEELQEENNLLKSQIQELKQVNESQSEKVRLLERKLDEKILEEQKEAQDLESMVQQVEKNLQLMTKRAAKAEGNVTKLKQELALLQIQLSTYKTENEAFRRGETAGMNAVKDNVNLALENLHNVVSGAQSSIRQLLSGAEALNLVADLLRSIDKIAEIHSDDVP